VREIKHKGSTSIPKHKKRNQDICCDLKGFTTTTKKAGIVQNASTLKFGSHVPPEKKG
jgi:hypothetical protein